MARAVPANVSRIGVAEDALLIPVTGRNVPWCRVVHQVDELALLEDPHQNLIPRGSGRDAGQSVVYPALHNIHVMSLSSLAFPFSRDSSTL
jgi:hypothetical protein